VIGQRDGDAIEVRVRDDGAGIAPELLARIFDIFVQGSRTLDRAQGGLGIGLSVARALVELHGGKLTAYSEGHGKGSEFVVLLPAAQVKAEREPAAPALARSAPEMRGRVLVVDDNQDAADVLAEGLSNAGYVIDVAYDGPSALAAAERARHDVALLDLGLPVMDGYELARQLRAHDSPAVLVAVTGYGQSLDRSKTAAAGFSQHLVKPVPLPQILKAVESALAGARHRGAP
jgi:CheY-like chemotaxis protein